MGSETKNLYITHVDSDGDLLKIWGQKNRISASYIESQLKQLGEELENTLNPSIVDIKLNMLCFGKYSDDRYYRARIIDIHQSIVHHSVTVVFVDYGNTDVVKLSRIRIPEDESFDILYKMPEQAEGFYVAGVGAPVTGWSINIVSEIQNEVCYDEFPFEIAAQVGDQKLVELLYQNEEFSSHLIKKKLASPLTLPAQKQLVLSYCNLVPVEEPSKSPMKGNNKVTVPSPSKANVQPARRLRLAKEEPTPNLTERTCQPTNYSAPAAIGQVKPAQRMSTRIQNEISKITEKNFSPSTNHATKPASLGATSSLPNYKSLNNSPKSPKENGNPSNGSRSVMQPVVLQVKNNRPKDTTKLDSKSPDVLNYYLSLALDEAVTHNVIVSHIDDGPWSFSVQLLSSETELRNLKDELALTKLTPIKHPIPLGNPCIAYSNLYGHFCRGIIICFSLNAIKVYLVDFGSTESLNRSDIYEFPPKFFNRKILSHKFSLTGLRNIPYNNDIKKLFAEIVQKELLTLRITSQEEHNQISCELFLKDKSVKTILTEKIKEMRRSGEEFPRMGDSEKVFVTHVVNPQKFFVQSLKRKSELELIKTELSKTEKEGEPLTYRELYVGFKCVSKVNFDRNWARAVITSVDGEDTVSVFYVDYGKNDIVDISVLKTTKPSGPIDHISYQAMQCCLKGFEDKPYDRALCKKLESLILEKELDMTIVDTKRRLLCVQLSDHGKDISEILEQYRISLHEASSQTSVTTTSLAPTPRSQRLPEFDEPSTSTIYSETKISLEEDWKHDLYGDDDRDTKQRYAGEDRRERDERGLGSRSDRDAPTSVQRAGRRDRSLSPPKYKQEKKDRRGDYQRDEPKFEESEDDWESPKTKGRKARRGSSKAKESEDDWDRPRTKEVEARRGSSKAKESEEDWDSPKTKERKAKKGSPKAKESEEDWDSPETKERKAKRGSSKAKESEEEWDRPKSREVEARRDRSKAKESEDDWDRPKSKEVEAKRDRSKAKESEEEWDKPKPEFSKSRQQQQEPETESGPSQSRRDRDFERTKSSQPIRSYDDREDTSDDRKRFGDSKPEDEPRRIKARDVSAKSTKPYLEYGQPTALKKPISKVDVAPAGTTFPERSIQLGSSEEGVVSCFFTPDDFFVQSLAQEEDFQQMMSDLQTYYEDKHPIIDPIQVGDIVIARYSKTKLLYRAEVIRATPLTVRHVDFGNQEPVKPLDTWLIDRRFLRLPKQAFRCRLLHVQPADLYWPPPGSRLKSYFDKKYKCTFETFVNNCYGIQLKDTETGKDVATEIVDAGFAHHVRPKLDIPEIDYSLLPQQVLRLYISCVLSPFRFYAIINPKMLEKIENEIKLYKNLMPLREEMRKSGVYCLSTDDNVSWYRACFIRKTDEGKALVWFVDRGDTVEVPSDKVMSLPSHLKEVEPQAVECTLYNVFSINEEKFKKDVQYKHFLVSIVSISQKRLCVILYDDDGRILDFQKMKCTPHYINPIADLPLIYQKIPVIISHIESPAEIYVQRPTDEEEISNMTDLMEKFYSEDNEDLEIEKEGTEGLLVAAKSILYESWYRGQVLSSTGDFVEVFFVDYGNRETLPRDRVKKLSFSFFTLHAFSKKLSLDVSFKTYDALDITNKMYEVIASRIITGFFFNDNGNFITDFIVDGQEITQTLVSLDLVDALNTVDFSDIFSGGKPKRGFRASTGEPCPRVRPEGVPVFLSYISSPNEIWVHLEKNMTDLMNFQAQLQDICKTSADKETLKVGDIAAFKFSNTWYRAEVIDIDENFIVVQFIDFGNILHLDQTYNDIKELPEEFLKSPVLAECYSLRGEWKSETTVQLEKIISENKAPLSVVVLDKATPPTADFVQKGQSITNILIHKGLLLEKEHPLKSGRSFPRIRSVHGKPSRAEEEEAFAKSIKRLLLKENEEDSVPEAQEKEKPKDVLRHVSFEEKPIEIKRRDIPEHREFEEKPKDKPKDVLRHVSFEEKPIEIKRRDVPEHREFEEKVKEIKRRDMPEHREFEEKPKEIKRRDIPEHREFEEKPKEIKRRDVPEHREFEEKPKEIKRRDVPEHREFEEKPKEIKRRDIPEHREFEEKPKEIKRRDIPEHREFEEKPKEIKRRDVPEHREFEEKSIKIKRRDIAEGKEIVKPKDDQGRVKFEEKEKPKEKKETKHKEYHEQVEEKDEELHSVLLTFFTSPSDFFIQKESHTSTMTLLNEALSQPEKFANSTTFEKDRIYAAQYPDDESWYRARIAEVTDSSIEVVFIDFGNKSLVNELKYLPEELENIPPLAENCSLLFSDDYDSWSEAAIDKFMDYTNSDKLKMEVVHKKGNKKFVKLFNGNKNVLEDLEPLCEKDGRIDVCIPHFVSLNEFYIQKVNDDSNSLIMEKLMSGKPTEIIKNVQPGMLCLARYEEDNLWYRGKVLKKVDDGWEIFFIDFGNTSISKELKKLPPEVESISPRALKCSLDLPEGNIPKRATEEFINFVEQEQIFKVKIISRGECNVVSLKYKGLIVEEFIMIEEEGDEEDDFESSTSDPTN